jgi:membrane-associated protease RseP (regulator of RpoE activity)
MDYAFGVVFFVVALLVSVMLHEAGHFLTAKHYGMKASRFFVGFGPTLWSTHRGETEYGVKAIPAGGFVKIVGMTDLEEIEPGDEERVFYRQPASHRVVVLAAGSVVHFLLAILLLFLVLATTGDILKIQPTLKIDAVSACVPLDPNEAACSKKDPAAPAAGKLQAGDTVVAVDGRRVTSYDKLRTRISASPGQALTFTVLRKGVQTDVTVTPIAVPFDGQTVGRVGIAPVQRLKPLSVAAAVPRTFTTLGTMTAETGRALGGLPHEVSQILKGQQRSASGAASVVDIARVSEGLLRRAARQPRDDRRAAQLLRRHLQPAAAPAARRRPHRDRRVRAGAAPLLPPVRPRGPRPRRPAEDHAVHLRCSSGLRRAVAAAALRRHRQPDQDRVTTRPSAPKRKSP